MTDFAALFGLPIDGGAVDAAFDAINAELVELEAELAILDAIARLYVVGCFQPGTATASMRLLMHVLPHPVTLPPGLAGSAAVAIGAATAAVSYTLAFLRGGVLTPIALFSFAAGASVATVAMAVVAGVAVAAPALLAGDALVLTGPASPDATLADVGFSVLAAKA